MKNKIWNGRIKRNTDKEVEDFTSSIKSDVILYSYDITGTAAYSAGLFKIGIITKKELEKVFYGLKKIKLDIEKDNSIDISGYEDIHSLVEKELGKIIGDTANKIHTGRSRNDQIVLDEKLFLKDIISIVLDNLLIMQENIIKRAKSAMDVIIPAYTHLQKAQPVLFSHYLMSYFYKFERDIDSLFYNFEGTDSLPAGAAACSGSGYELDIKMLKNLLKFKSIDKNSMDTVGSRDFIMDFVYTCSKIMIHLSRICEDLIIYGSNEFSMIDIDESFCTGSSIMPQKKNPDVLELIRGKSSVVTGNLMQLMTLIKGLPSTYNRDIQEDKTILFNAYKETISSISIFSRLTGKIKINKIKVESSLKEGFMEATDIADYLVKKGESFRKAHNITGEIISYCISKKISFGDLKLEELKKYSSYFDNDVYDYADIKSCISHKKVDCGTGKSSVASSISYAGEKADSDKKKLKDLQKRIPSADNIFSYIKK
ncbi:MAG: argininosuccinate lyase [Actinomycetota bacterium]|nr:argininosuccinate lyase [Actinomycetota bacterium]